MNLRPDKVKGVVLIDKVDYHNCNESTVFGQNAI